MRLTAWHTALTLSVTAHAATLGWGALRPAPATAVPPGDAAADYVRLTVVAVASLPSPARPRRADKATAPRPQEATPTDAPVVTHLPDNVRVVPAARPHMAQASRASVQRVATHMLEVPPAATALFADAPVVQEFMPTAGRPAIATMGDSAPAVPVRGHNPPPPYPRIARHSGWEGTVLLDVEINTAGRVELIGIAYSSGHAILDTAAIEAVRAWQFTPARAGGLALHSAARVPIIFRLEE